MSSIQSPEALTMVNAGELPVMYTVRFLTESSIVNEKVSVVPGSLTV